MDIYLSGTGRTTISLESSLLRSLSSNEDSVMSEGDLSEKVAAKRQNRSAICTRGCSTVLSI